MRKPKTLGELCALCNRNRRTNRGKAKRNHRRRYGGSRCRGDRGQRKSETRRPTLSLQHVYDAIKRVRADGEAWVTWKGKRLRLVEPDADERIQGDAIVRSRAPGGIALAWFDGYKDVGGRVRIYEAFPGTANSYITSWDNILAIVVEQHPREQ